MTIPISRLGKSKPVKNGNGTKKLFTFGRRSMAGFSLVTWGKIFAKKRQATTFWESLKLKLF
jgi:hypothetical protein